MSRKSRTPKNSRPKKTEATSTVTLTHRDLVTVMDGVNERMCRMCDSLREDAGLTVGDRQWRLYELVKDGELIGKLRHASSKFVDDEDDEAESRTA